MPPADSADRPAASVRSIGKFYHPRSGGVEIVTQTIAEEVVHTTRGLDILKNFLLDVCGCKGLDILIRSLSSLPPGYGAVLIGHGPREAS